MCIALNAAPTTIERGQSTTLTWETRNATAITIDNGVGSVEPVAGGSVSVSPTATTTYTATVTGATGSVNCQTTVTVTPPTTTAPQCVSLTLSPASIKRGESATLTWETRNARSVTITGITDQPTADEFAQGSRTVSPTANTTYTVTVVGDTGASDNCAKELVVIPPTGGNNAECIFLRADKTRINRGEEVTLSWETRNATAITIDNGVGSVTPVREGTTKVNPTSNTTYTATVTGRGPDVHCDVSVTINTGGGGGGRNPRVILDSFIPELEEPLAFVYLSEVPHTGLELGPIGTVVYWLMLIGWSIALAYLVLFNAVPFAFARMRRFGSQVQETMNADAAPIATVVPVAPAMQTRTETPTYSQHDGFRSFAAGDGLTIDDIVKGLTREIEQKQQTVVSATAAVPTHEEVVAAVQHAPAPVFQTAAPAVPTAAITGDVRDFIEALLKGERDTVFGMIRNKARQGEDTELFVSQAACALDDAYRACIDGTTCHPDIAELTQGCHPSFLERLVASLSTAVDGSYSAGMTGVKIALTRALGVVAG